MPHPAKVGLFRVLSCVPYYIYLCAMIKLDTIYNEDCLLGMQRIPDGSVNAIITDPPYGTTDNKWDIAPNIEEMFRQFWRVLKHNGALLIFGQEPFASLVRLSSGHFRYDWIWEKSCPVGFLNAKKMPLRKHEVITVHYRRLPTYNPQFTEGKPYIMEHKSFTPTYSSQGRTATISDGRRYPVDVLRFKGANGAVPKDGKPNTIHPTQKPQNLIEYLVKTYTDEGQIVLDPYMGSGTTAAACITTGRHYIGFELDEDYYKKSLHRIEGLG